MISVFSENITNRLSYVLDFFFKSKGQDYQIISSQIEWVKIKTNRINYSNFKLDSEIHIIPSQLLFENNIRESFEIKSDLIIDDVLDEFAIVFFFLTRYEEYLIDKTDEHGRIPSNELFAVKNKIHRIPIADKIVKEIWIELKLDYYIILDKFQCVPSFDIDIAWAYKNRKPLRQIGAFVKGGNISERYNVLRGKMKDPYDTYSYMAEVSAKVSRIICFVLLGDWSKYDKNIHWQNEEYSSLIRGLNASGGMGIHPSYESYLNKNRVEEEKNRLYDIVGHEVLKSRQHFLRLKFPESYQVLIDAGIQKDYSMGFADEVGFRAGTSFPYKYFSLETNKETELTVFPFAYMDSALKDYLNLDIQQAKSQVQELIQEVKNVGGNFMCIWHNSSIGNYKEWDGWRSVLDLTIEESNSK